MKSSTGEASFNTPTGSTSGFIAVRLKEQIVKEHEMKINSCSFWSDSTTVLQWIQSSNRKQQVFVGHRLAEIQDTTDVSPWKHVSGINTQWTLAHEQSTFKDSREETGSLSHSG